MNKKKDKAVIGWREFVDLPEWGIRGLRAKIDTGAQTSALHVEDIRVLPSGRISFYVILNRSKSRKKVTARPIKKARVKSSTGTRTKRWYVHTKLRLGQCERKILVNLVGREGMNFRMLVGRSAMGGKFIVDVSKSFLTIPPNKRRKVKLNK